jgi:uncharacterized hydrophobic protein (TIGR00271 family)
VITGLKKILSHGSLSPEERRGVLEDLFVFGKDNQAPFLIRMTVLLVLSTFIATAGLLSDSAAVVIGAMLVAPMMNPVMASAGAVVMGWSARFYGAGWLLLSMGVGAVALSAFITFLSPDILFMPEQVLARTRPTYYDLLIALAAGSAGAYTITHRESGAIPGVAVAVALLPPLASAGILLVSGEFELAVRAVVLFFTNLVAMVLAGALTFMACGVSPPSARRRSAAFIKNKLLLFATLVVAISIPLFFYSQKIIFNAEYRAAKSEILQAWLLENKLSLVDVDIMIDKRLIFLGLEGPDPPVNIQSLYESIQAVMEENHPNTSFTLRYSWTPKVSGAWPLSSEQITAAASSDKEQIQQLLAHDWVWELTQYDSERGSKPAGSDQYVLRFSDRNKLHVMADCGKKAGVYRARGKSIDMEMKRLNWFGCRKDEALQVFFGDLQRSREFYIEEGRLRITLSTDSGLMYFRKR